MVAVTRTSLNPLANTIDASLSSDIQIVFDGNITGAPTSSQIIISSNQRGLISGSFSGGNGTDTVTFNPTSNLKEGEKISITIVDTVGSTSVDAYSYSFLVEVAQSSGNFISTTNSLGTFGSYGVAIGDIDGDGDLDAIFTDFDQPNRVYVNDGSGNFSTTTNSLGSDGTYDIDIADVDGDGDLDIVEANNEANRVYVNDGSGNFSSTSNSLGTFESYGVAIGDLDGDGDNDAIFANDRQPNQVYLNDGSGNFSTTTNSLGTFRSSDVAIGDLDGDGDLDAIFANRNDEPNQVYLNDGSGNFSTTTNSLGSFTSYSLAIGDIDGDGDLDAIFGNSGDSNQVYLNDGSGNFSTTTNSLVTSRTNRVAMADIDGDADLDVIFANSNSINEPSRVYVNDGSGNFSSTTNSFGDFSFYDVAIGDIDGDGDLDALLASYNEQNQAYINNNPPEFTSTNTPSIDENTTEVITVTATDSDGDDLSLSITGGNDQALFTLDNSNVLSFIEAPDFENTTDTNGDGKYEVQVTADDGASQTIQKLLISVNDVTDAPEFTSSDTVEVAENTTAVTTVTATDNDGDEISLSITGGADQALFSLNSETGELSFIAAPDFENPTDDGTDNTYQVEVTADDSTENGTTIQTITVTVVNGNEAPVFTSSDTVEIAENNSEVITVTTTDEESDTVTYSVTGGDDRSLFDIDSETGELTFTTAPNFENPSDNGTDNVYQVEVTADDGNEGGTTTQNIQITVTDVNEAPVFTSSDTVEIAENISQVTTVTTTDDDGDTVTYSVTGGDDSSLFNIDSQTGELSFIAAPDFENPIDNGTDNVYDVEVTADDGNEGGTTTRTIQITVIDGNELPIFTSSNEIEIKENNTEVTTVTTTDEEGDTITYSISGGADGNLFDIDSQTGELTFIQAPEFKNPTDSDGNNVYEVEVSADDGNQGITTQTIQVSVNIDISTPPIDGDRTIDNTINIPENNTTLTEGTENNDDINGSSGDDTITGNSGQDSIEGNDGNDDINGNQDNDTITGGDGNDLIRGGKDDDWLNGEEGEDTLFGDLGNDTINGGNENDWINGNEGDDIIDGGDGEDTIYGGKDNDCFFGGNGDDNMFGNLGNDTVYGEAGDDIINGNEGNDTVYGGDGEDTLYGGKENDFVSGGDNDDFVSGDNGDDEVNGNMGNDTVNGGDGDDTVYGGKDNDEVNGGNGDDIVNGDNGDDMINGNIGNDTVNGGEGNDTVYGGKDDDSLSGGEGDDLLSGDFGSDILTGGNGDDTFVLNNEIVGVVETDTVTDFNTSDDLFALTSSAYLNAPTAGTTAIINDAASSVDSAENIIIDSLINIQGVNLGNTRFAFDTTNNNLLYDGDGDWASGNQIVADVTLTGDLSSDNFSFV